MNEAERLKELCQQGLTARGLSGEKVNARLAEELNEVAQLKEYDYYLDLHDRRVRYGKNEHNSLIAYLLGIVSEINLEKPPEYTTPEFPDVDVDYLPPVRAYIKEVFTQKQYGEEYVCHIGSYNTYGLKSALIDMTRVFGGDRNEILAITTKLGLKDDEGDPLSWDKALEIYPTLKDWVERNPQIAAAAKGLLYAEIDWDQFGYKEPPRRNRSMGTHAGGVIVSSKPITDLVPLVRGKDGARASAWVEGLHGQDLSLVGLVKFDCLVIEALTKVSMAIDFIRKRNPGIYKIMAVPGGPNFSDLSYLNDPACLKAAADGDLKMVFQFDSEYIRKLAMSGGVTSFDDMVAYTALNRPGPMDVGMDYEYVNRKKWKESNGREGKSYHLHPIMEEIVGRSYGICVYQEDVMKVLNRVGLIPLSEGQGIIKAISKKQVAKFAKFKEQFIANAQKTLDYTEEQATDLWGQIESFAGYGFNASVDKGQNIRCFAKNGVVITKPISDFTPGDQVLSVDESGNTVPAKVVRLHDHGEIYGYEVTFDDGESVICSLYHKFLTEHGQVPLREIVGHNYSILCDNSRSKGIDYAEEERGWVADSVWVDRTEQEKVVRTSENMCRMPGKMLHSGQIQSPVRAGVQKQEGVESTPAQVRSLPEDSLENGCQWEGGCRAPGSVRGDAEYVEEHGRAPTTVCGVRSHQACQHQAEERDYQSIRRTPHDFFKVSTNYFCSPRDSDATGRSVTCLAGEEPGQVRGDSGEDVGLAKEVTHGGMVATKVGLGDGTDTLWGRKKAGGFGEWECLDRGGWFLPFSREPALAGRPWVQAVVTHSGTRRDAECRGSKAWGCNAPTVGHGVLRDIDGGPEATSVGLGAGYAPVADTGRLVRRRIVRIVPVGKRRMYDLEVDIPTHNFLLSNGVVTSNSHAVAYTYVTMMQLWLKTHYPIEYITAVLCCLKTGDDRLQEYKLDAERREVKVVEADINLSGVNFEIRDDRIYWGLSKIKGIGEDMATKIVEHQPYHDFKDFLDRFGTDGTVMKSLLGVRIFKDQEPTDLMRVYLKFKDHEKKKSERAKRFQASQEKLFGQLREVLNYGPDDDLTGMKFEDFQYRAFDLEKVDEFKAVWKKVARGIEAYQAKQAAPMDLADEGELDIDPKLAAVLADADLGQMTYYGFVWTHPLQKCPNASLEFTFDAHKAAVAKGHTNYPVDVLLVTVEEVVSKKGKPYCRMQVEDAQFVRVTVNVWMDDYLRFKPELKAGSLVRLDLDPPSGGFPSYGLHSVPPWKKRSLPPKEADFRVVVLGATEVKKLEV